MHILLLAAVVVLVDQTTKNLAASGALQASWIKAATNPEFALGILGSSTAIEVTAAVIGIIVGWRVLRRYRHGMVGGAAVSLLLGGSLGNLLDRVLNGEVRDFIVGPGILYNIADVALLSGLLILSAGSTLRHRRLSVRPSNRSMARTKSSARATGALVL